MRYEAQPNFYYCGPAATRNALCVQGKNINVDDMAKEMGTTEAGTNSINDITPVLNKETGKNDAYRSVEISSPDADTKQTDQLRADIVRTVDDGRAVVANIAGTSTDTDGGVHSYEGGHYISVVGYRDNGNTVNIADSADPNTGLLPDHRRAPRRLDRHPRLRHQLTHTHHTHRRAGPHHGVRPFGMTLSRWRGRPGSARRTWPACSRRRR